MSAPDDPTAADRVRRARWNQVGYTFLGLCAVFIAVDVISTQFLGTNTNSTFSSVASPPTPPTANSRPPVIAPAGTTR